MPDISTKEKAQKFIGLEMQKLKAAKEEFLKTTTVKWDEDAKKRQGFLYEYKLENQFIYIQILIPRFNPSEFKSGNFYFYSFKYYE